MKKRVLSLLLCLIMALSLIPTAAFATEVADVEETPVVETPDATDEVVVLNGHKPGGSGGQGGGGGSVTPNTVSHIDIQMALVISNTVTAQLDNTDLNNLVITAKQGSTDITNFNISNRTLNGSTDGSNNKQARLSGSFPIGTSDNPVVYTITLTKTVKGTPYTLTLTANYWSESNVCPGKGTHNDPGIDVKFGTGSSMPQVTITKEITGIEAEDLVAGKEFTFEVKNAKNESVTPP